MDKLFRWGVIVALSLLTLHAVAEYIEKPVTPTPVEVVSKLTIHETSSWVYSVDENKVSTWFNQKEIKVNLPKKKVAYKTPQWVMYINWSKTHSSRKEEMEAQPVLSTREVQELIRKYAQKHWVDEWLALRIAWSESWYRYWAKNKISSAGGVFQQMWKYREWRANKYWHPWASRFNAEANIDVSIQMLKNEWTSHWNESKHARGR